MTIAKLSEELERSRSALEYAFKHRDNSQRQFDDRHQQRMEDEEISTYFNVRVEQYQPNEIICGSNISMGRVGSSGSISCPRQITHAHLDDNSGTHADFESTRSHLTDHINELKQELARHKQSTAAYLLKIQQGAEYCKYLESKIQGPHIQLSDVSLLTITRTIESPLDEKSLKNSVDDSDESDYIADPLCRKCGTNSGGSSMGSSVGVTVGVLNDTGIAGVDMRSYVLWPHERLQQDLVTNIPTNGTIRMDPLESASTPKTLHYIEEELAQSHIIVQILSHIGAELSFIVNDHMEFATTNDFVFEHEKYELEKDLLTARARIQSLEIEKVEAATAFTARQKKFEQQICELNQQIEAKNRKLFIVCEELKTCDDSKAQLQLQIDTFVRERSETITFDQGDRGVVPAQSSLYKLKKDLSMNEEKIVELESRLTAGAVFVSKLQAHLQITTRELEELKVSTGEYDAIIAALRAKILSDEKEIANLRAMMQDGHDYESKFKSTLERANQEIEHLKAQYVGISMSMIASKDAEIEQLRKRLDEGEEYESSLQVQLESEQQNVGGMNHDKYEMSLKSPKSEIVVKDLRIEELTSKLHSGSQELKRLDECLQIFEIERDELRAAKGDWEAKLMKQSVIFLAKDNEIAELRRLLADGQEYVHRLELHCKALTRELDDLKVLQSPRDESVVREVIEQMRDEMSEKDNIIFRLEQQLKDIENEFCELNSKFRQQGEYVTKLQVFDSNP